MDIYPTPAKFLTKTNIEYPPGNKMIFEEFFYNKFLKESCKVNRVYLPIQWTSYYLENRPHQNLSSSDNDIQIYLNSIPTDNKYFTIVQYADGIVNNTNHLNLFKFSSGGIGDYPIPLNCLSYEKLEQKRDIFASFVGVIKGRHSIREKMYQHTHKMSDYIISECVNFNYFKNIMNRSIFSLCPRGYGKTSFRISESLNLGSIPVYIYDDPWIPFNDKIDFNEYGVLIHESDLNKIDKILKSYSDEQIKKMQEYGQYIYNEYYLYESCYKKIIDFLNNDNN